MVQLQIDVTAKNGSINGQNIEYLEIKCWLDPEHYVNLKAVDKTSKEYLLAYVKDNENKKK